MEKVEARPIVEVTARHERQQRDRVVLRRLGGVAQRGRHRARVRVGDVVQVGEEDHVELAALADAGDVLVELRPRPVVAGGRGAGMPPHGQAVIGRPVHRNCARCIILAGITVSLASIADPLYRSPPDRQEHLRELYPI